MLAAMLLPLLLLLLAHSAAALNPLPPYLKGASFTPHPQGCPVGTVFLT